MRAVAVRAACVHPGPRRAGAAAGVKPRPRRAAAGVAAAPAVVPREREARLVVGPAPGRASRRIVPRRDAPPAQVVDDGDGQRRAGFVAQRGCARPAPGRRRRRDGVQYRLARTVRLRLPVLQSDAAVVDRRHLPANADAGADQCRSVQRQQYVATPSAFII